MSKTILSTGQQRLFTVLAVVGGFLLANAAYLYFAPPGDLPAFYQWMLVLHVLLGIGILVPVVVFVFWHLKRALAMRNRVGVWTGSLLTAAVFGLLVTGLFMFSEANSGANAWAWITHTLLAVAVPTVYVAHRLVAKHRPAGRTVARGFAAPVVMLGVALAIHFAVLAPEPEPPQSFVERPAPGVDPYKEQFPEEGAGGAPRDSVFFPANTRTATNEYLPGVVHTNDDRADPELLERDLEEYGFAVEARIGSETCARCHADIVEQWATSAHRYSSFNNPFYRFSIENIREEEDGKVRSQWCGGCHDPAVMMPGNMLADIDPASPEAQAGLTCLACHAMDEVHGVGGNGNYRISTLRDRLLDPYLGADAKEGEITAEMRDLLIKSKPQVHVRDLIKPVFRTDEYCATCHKVSLDVAVNGYRWLRGQDEYDAHQDSGVTRNNARTFYLPEKAKSCIDCHMPLVDAPGGDLSADSDGKVRSHAFLAVNTALAHIRGDTQTLAAQEALLRGAVTVDVFAARSGEGEVAPAPDLRDVPLTAAETAELQLVVRNKGVGHRFPGGTTDSNQAWIELVVRYADGDGEELLASGRVDATSHRIDPEAHFYRTVFVDEHSQVADQRNPQHFRALVYSTTIGPGTADIVRYAVPVPPEAAGRRLRVSARLLWRKFPPAYTEAVWKQTMPGREVPVLPITEISSTSVEFPVVADGASAADLDPALLTEKWVRANDWGIGLLLQGDTVGATRAFELVRDAVPDRVDGWRNLARAKIAEGDTEAAIELLQQAEQRAPGNPQNAYFFGLARERAGQLDEAVKAFERAREDFPRDRTIHRRLGGIRYRLGEFETALDDFLEVLAIDPEDREAHYHRMLIYGALEDEPAADEARKAYEKYQIDENAQKWTNEIRRRRPDLNRESQRVHVHTLAPAR